jgi:hypothetical protein
MKKAQIKGSLIDKEELIKMGFELNIFNYYVEVSIRDFKGELFHSKCKTIDLGDGKEPFYFTESEDSVFIFRASDNPTMKIKKLLLN